MQQEKLDLVRDCSSCLQQSEWLRNAFQKSSLAFVCSDLNLFFSLLSDQPREEAKPQKCARGSTRHAKKKKMCNNKLSLIAGMNKFGPDISNKKVKTKAINSSDLFLLFQTQFMLYLCKFVNKIPWKAEIVTLVINQRSRVFINTFPCGCSHF